jgi:hypothetical protein
MYSGTFRWNESKKFISLPDFPYVQSNQTDEKCDFDLTKGWGAFLTRRGRNNTNLVEIAKKDPSMLDALTYPMTFIRLAKILNLFPTTPSHPMNIVVLGSTVKAEQRVWNITNYWLEIAHFFSQHHIKLWFVGPEAAEEVTSKTLPKNLTVLNFRGCFGDFQSSTNFKDFNPKNTIMIGYNTGFGNFVETSKYELFFSWLPDLYKIAESNIPTLFTCANDYADMNGEFAVQSRIIGSKMLLLPQENTFSAASHLHEEGKKETSWSRANSFVYAIQGFDPTRRLHLKQGDATSLKKRLDAELDMHLEDRLGRHFIKGIVLTKEQAARCKLIQKIKTPPDTQQQVTLEVPRYEILPGGQEKEMMVLVDVPKASSNISGIAVDVNEKILRLLIPGKYYLETQLPFEVANNAQVRANLFESPTTGTPIIRILFHLK